MIKHALISVSDKTGIVEFAQTLSQMGVSIISTGGTEQLLTDNGIPVTEVSEHTGFPEMLDGRVKTLHPKIHGGILARRSLDAHTEALAQHEILTIDMVVVNLYPFMKAIASATCTLEEAIENIDIGGPAMLRSAAKNHQDVIVVCDPNDYDGIIKELELNNGELTEDSKFQLAIKVYSHTARYDGAIADYLSSLGADKEHRSRSRYPQTMHMAFEKVQDLRYGENPHQSAAFYRDLDAHIGALASYSQLQGKELSYNNIADADAAWECAKTFEAPACVIIKHANPCGAAIGNDLKEAYKKALKTDPEAAFGGIIAFNRQLDADAAREVANLFVEVLIAPDFTLEAREILKSKKNLRLLEIPNGRSMNEYEIKRVGGGTLLQAPDARNLALSEMEVVTKLHPTAQQFEDMMFAWRVAKFVKSNAIVFCANGMTQGIGAGQVSRVDAARAATMKAELAGLSLANTAVASDAFFPFRDGLDVVADAGATCIIQPGGSVRDQEVIDAANERGLVMMFTGIRHFRH